EGRFLVVNESLCRIVGYTAEELVTLTFQEITYPDDLEFDLEYRNQLLDGQIRSYDLEKRYIHKNGEPVWAELSVSLVTDDDGNPVHFVAQIQSIDDRKRAQEALRRSEAQRAEAERLHRTLVEQLPLGMYIRPLDMSKPNIYASPQ